MLKLKRDPWDPGYGGSVEIEDPEGSETEVGFDVEDVPWAVIDCPAPAILPRVAFVDGVRRVDLRMFVETAATEAPALAGSWAVGAVWGERGAGLGEVALGRDLILGGGHSTDDLQVEVGDFTLLFKASSVEDVRPTAPMQALQEHMRKGEAALAKALYEHGQADLLVIDGPLTYFSANGPVLGFIKRQSKAYLSAEQARIFRDLKPHARTPLFRLSNVRSERYSWYTRIAFGAPIDGMMTGIVRCEVSTEVGREEAVRLADLASGLFPRFASQGWHDPRAPQNLYPVGHLETLLRHRLGDALLIRRAIEVSLHRMGADARDESNG
jgi:hypothetical protein